MASARVRVRFRELLLANHDRALKAALKSCLHEMKCLKHNYGGLLSLVDVDANYAFIEQSK